MLKIRIIPTLLWKGVGLVKGVGFDSWRRVGPVLPAIKVYNTRDVDELVLVDITANTSGEPPDIESVTDFADECFVPFTVGGGVRDTVQMQQLLRAGADKVCLNTGAFETPDLISEAARRFGAQCVVVSIDARRNEGGWECFTHSGTRATGRSPAEWAHEAVQRGAGEILITSIDRDGTMQGYDLALVEQVVRAVSVPVVASGGAGNYEHMRQAVQDAGASAVAAASMFHFTEQTPAGAKAALAAAGVAVRTAYTPPAG
ncbi:MAG: imidazole glycerol phosphate synthase cyclase subunit [Proteobacteria bacterium]|nr:imidazole glycerol phosphate synthase cyclase subunit [Pseudomonadota bacterium]